MAYDYENYKKFYNAMNDTQRAKWAESNKNDADFNDFMSRYNSDSNATKSYVTPKQSNYQSQGEGNYVYNEKTGYYENQTNTSKNTVNQGIAPQPETKQEVIKQTPTKQSETVITTDTKNNQRGALTPASNEYYQQTSDEALNKIRNNLNNYRQTNPEYFSDYDSFKKNFSYDLRNDEQKNVLDTWYTGYSKGLELSATPVTDLYTQYQNGEVSINDLENLRISNPTKYSELTAQINKGNIISAYDDDKGTDKMNIQEMAYEMAAQTFKAFMEGGSGASSIFSEYEEKMNDPEMLALGDQCTEYEAEIEQIQDDIASMKKQVEAEYEGTGASRAKINAIIADRTYDLQLQLRTANSNYNKVANQYNNRMQQYQQEYTMKLQEYQLNMQERNQQMNELGFAMDLMNFETNEQKQQRERDYWVKQQQYQNGDINSSDYQTRYKAALKSVENLLSQYEGIPMVRSAEQMAEDILKGIDQNGTTLGEELSKINKQIQQKDEYKYLYNNTFKSGTSNSSLIQDSMKVGDTEWVKYNDKRYTADEFNKMLAGGGMVKGDAKPYDTVDESVLANDIRGGTGNNLGKFLLKKLNGTTGGQCGKYVNDYLQFIGMTGAANRYYDDELSTKLNSVNSYTPKVGTIAVFDYGHKSSDGINHGHVGIVTKVYSDGSFDVRDSNYSSNEKIQTRHISSDDALRGFFDPSKPPMGASTQGGNSSFVSGSIDGVPLAYERAVKNLVPAALQNSDAEREALNTVITNSYNGGIDQSQIALTFMGFDIRNENDKNLALDLVNTVRTLSTDTQEGIVQTISDLMNQGNYTKAIQTVENAVSQQAQAAGNYIPESSVKNTMNRVNSLSNYISSLKDSPVGVVEGNMQEWLGKLSSSKSKEILNRIAAVESTLDIKDADTRARILPQLTDQPSVFMSKLNNLNENLLSELNGWREIYGLPDLTTEALQNYSSRVSLYRNPQQIKTTTTATKASGSMDMEGAIRSLNAKFGLK